LAFNSVIVGLTFRKSQNFRTFQSCKRLSARAGLFQMKSQISLEGINREEVISKNRQASVEACRFLCYFNSIDAKKNQLRTRNQNEAPRSGFDLGMRSSRMSAL
jgi:hypothetical protein